MYYKLTQKKEILSREVVEGMTELVSFYDRQSKDVFHTSNEITSEIKKINEIKNILREKLNKFQDTGDRLILLSTFHYIYTYYQSCIISEVLTFYKHIFLKY